VEVKEQLLRLVRLQEVVLETRAARATVETAPSRLEDIESRFRERNAEYVAVKQRYDALEADQRTRSGELELLEEQHKKYKADLMQVQNQREYSAMLKEIDSIQARISEHEEAILKDMEELESAKGDLASHEDHIKAEREHVKTEEVEVQTATEAARKAVDELAQERKRIESELPRPLASAVQRLEAGRQGIFLSKAVDGVCQSCFVRIRPQVFQEIKLALKVHYCSNCRRLLYHEPTLKPAEPAETGEESSPAQPDADKVQAIDGGAV
jgi:predicted  nucleic acid-binding Zn-ribbon protein